MPSAIWTGSISFGLVQVPVRLVGATKSKDVSFNQLEEGTGARIRYKKVSDADRRRGAARQDQARLRDLEGPLRHRRARRARRRCGPKGSHTIEIEEFVDLDEIDPLYFEQPYYLVPDKHGMKPYKLLVEAMTELNKVAIGRIVMRSQGAARRDPARRRRCCASRRCATPTRCCRADALVPDEDVELTERERAMARQLVESLAVDEFEPEKYHDEYREQVLDLIERKAAGEEIVAEPRRRAAGQGARPRGRARSVAREGRRPRRTATRAAPARADDAGEASGREACEEARREGDEGAGEEALAPDDREHLARARGRASRSRSHTGERRRRSNASHGFEGAADQVVRVVVSCPQR